MRLFSRITRIAITITLLLAILVLIPDAPRCDHAAGDVEKAGCSP